MNREELREWVWSRWGSRLERPTLRQLSEELVELQALAAPGPGGDVLQLDESPLDYEASVRQFLGQVLAGEPDEDFVAVWIAAVEWWLALMTDQGQNTGEDLGG